MCDVSLIKSPHVIVEITVADFGWVCACASGTAGALVGIGRCRSPRVHLTEVSVHYEGQGQVYILWVVDCCCRQRRHTIAVIDREGITIAVTDITAVIDRNDASSVRLDVTWSLSRLMDFLSYPLIDYIIDSKYK